LSCFNSGTLLYTVTHNQNSPYLTTLTRPCLVPAKVVDKYKHKWPESVVIVWIVAVQNR